MVQIQFILCTIWPLQKQKCIPNKKPNHSIIANFNLHFDELLGTDNSYVNTYVCKWDQNFEFKRLIFRMKYALFPVGLNLLWSERLILLEWLGQTSQVPNSWSYVMISGPAMLKSTLRNLSLTWPVARESDKLSNENNEMWLGMIRKVERYDKKPFGKLSFEYLDAVTNVTSNSTKMSWKKIRQCLTIKSKKYFYLSNEIYLQYIWFTFCYEYKAHDSLMKYDYWKRELVLNF